MATTLFKEIVASVQQVCFVSFFFKCCGSTDANAHMRINRWVLMKTAVMFVLS